MSTRQLTRLANLCWLASVCLVLGRDLPREPVSWAALVLVAMAIVLRVKAQRRERQLRKLADKAARARPEAGT